MLACIPVKNDSGLEGTIHDHFGSAPFFALYDTETDTIEVLKNKNEHHSHGTCHPLSQLQKFNIDCVICSGIGRRAIEMLNQKGIKVYTSETNVLKDMVVKIKENALIELDPSKACHGHGHGHRNRNFEV